MIAGRQARGCQYCRPIAISDGDNQIVLVSSRWVYPRPDAGRVIVVYGAQIKRQCFTTFNVPGGRRVTHASGIPGGAHGFIC